MKNRIKKSYLLLSFCFIVVVFGGNNAIDVLAAEPSVYTAELDLLFDENTDLQEMSDVISKINYEIEICLYPEVGLIHLSIPDGINIDEIVSNKSIKKNLEIQGNLGIIETEKMNLGDIYTQNLNTYGYEATVSQSISNEIIFDLMAWHVDEVTNNRESLELSKGNGIKIAVIDSGVDPYHPFLINNINFKDAKSFVSGNTSIIDTNGHGTMITGIICQIAPEAIITPYRVIGNSTGDALWTISAIIAAADAGNDIINMSLGAYVCKNDNSVKLTVKAFERAVKYAEKKDVIMVAASGNSGLDMKQIYKTEHIVFLPSSIKGVNGVSSVNNNQLTEYSNYGSNIQFCAPGGDYVFVDGF